MWDAYRMGGEEALARIALLARDDPDARVRLGALKVILEQTGKLKNTDGNSIDALAEAIKSDRKTHGFPPWPE